MTVTNLAKQMPNSLLFRNRGEVRIKVTGSWFPKRDDVLGVIELRQHFLDAFGEELRGEQNIYLDICVMSSDIDLDRAVAGCCTALDGQHGQVSAALWDDSMIRQIKVTRIGRMQRRPDISRAIPEERK